MSHYSDERSFNIVKYKVDILGINTSSLKPLTNEQNLELFKKMHKGDPFARDDLFQVGCLGLVKAIDNFDMSYNITLSTYACPMTFGWSKICRILL